MWKQNKQTIPIDIPFLLLLKVILCPKMSLNIAYSGTGQNKYTKELKNLLCSLFLIKLHATKLHLG